MGCAQRLHYHVIHSLNILQHIVVPESQHAKSRGFQSPRPHVVSTFHGCMLTTIHFENKSRVHANEVKNKIEERMLAAEFVSVHLTSTKHVPQTSLGVRHVFS